jgi:hypothetical protein
VAKGLSGVFNLKIGYKNNCKVGEASSSTSDVLSALDWAVQSAPNVKVFNYSYGLSPTGGSFPQTEADDSNAISFDRYANLYQFSLVVSAGNDGSSYSCGTVGCVNSPGTAYNVITVASMDDNNTVDRSDDGVSSFSSRGPVHRPAAPGQPTVDRYKPDVAAPGAVSSGSNQLGLLSTAYYWNQWQPLNPACPLIGTCPDYLRMAGTSMAAPHITGAVALLREMGVTNPLAAKAILLNTTDSTGWQSDIGWGYANLTRAYQQMNSFADSAGPSAYWLYKGSISNGFWSTITWNRLFDSTANPFVPDLDLYLYDRANDNVLDSSTSGSQNVEQVFSSATTNAVLKVKVYTSAFPTGVTSVPFAAALSQSGFTTASGPSLSVSCTAPTTVSTGQSFTATCTTRNSGDLEAFAPQATLTAASFTGTGARARVGR